MNPILLGKVQLEAYRLASTDAARPQLQGIHVAADGAVTATNGHALIQVSPVQDVDTSEYPTAGVVPPVLDAAGCILPAGIVREALRGLPKSKHLPLLRHALLAEAGERVALTTTDLDSTKRHEARKCELNYPNVEQTKPRDEPTLLVAFDPELLRNIMATLMAMDVTGNGVTLEFHGNGKPIVFRAKAESGEDVSGLVMPLSDSAINTVPKAGAA